MATIALELRFTCCPCARRGIPATFCMPGGNRGRRRLRFVCFLYDRSLPRRRQLSRGWLAVWSGLGGHHRVGVIGGACWVGLEGFSTGLQVDDFVRAALCFPCLRSFCQVSPPSSFRSTCNKLAHLSVPHVRAVVDSAHSPPCRQDYLRGAFSQVASSKWNSEMTHTTQATELLKTAKR